MAGAERADMDGATESGFEGAAGMETPAGDSRSASMASSDSGAASAGDRNAPSAAFRFYIRPPVRGEGSSDRPVQELGVADMAELQKLYHLGFLAPDDDVRRAGTDVWRKAGALPELKPAAPRPWLEGNEFVVMAVAICAATLLMIWLFG